MKRICLIFILIVFAARIYGIPDKLVWPAPPDEPRIEYLDEILLSELKPESGFFKKIIRFVGGKSKDEILSLPFDIVVSENDLYMICQNIPSLIKVDLTTFEYRYLNCQNSPFIYPVSLCQSGENEILIADPEAATIYVYRDGKVNPLIKDNLVRPTGVGVIAENGKIYVIDTGDHSLKIFNCEGILLKIIKEIDSNEYNQYLNYPTFAVIVDNEVLVNDALNYSIRRFNSNGEHIFSFGSEGDTPGHFGRPKGISVDSEDHIYVVDNLFDNIQIFDKDGSVLLVVGSRGNGPGQFWSPAGIDIDNDTIYIADTYNDRIQILRYMGDSK